MRYLQEQLLDWAAGRPRHFHRERDGYDQCCPDYSCCRPELLQSPEVRNAFLSADLETRRRFHVAFIAACGFTCDALEDHLAQTQWN